MQIKSRELILNIQARGEVWKSVVQDHIIFLIDGLAATSLFVIDLREPQELEEVIIDLEDDDPQEEIILPGEIDSVQVEPIIPEQHHLSTINRGNHLKDLAMGEKTLYVARGRVGLVLYNISSPARINFTTVFPPDFSGDVQIHNVRKGCSGIIAGGDKKLYFVTNDSWEGKIPAELPLIANIGPEPHFIDYSEGRLSFISDIEKIKKQEKRLVSRARIPGIGQPLGEKDNYLYIASGIGLFIGDLNDGVP